MVRVTADPVLGVDLSGLCSRVMLAILKADFEEKNYKYFYRSILTKN